MGPTVYSAVQQACNSELLFPENEPPRSLFSKMRAEHAPDFTFMIHIELIFVHWIK